MSDAITRKEAYLKSIGNGTSSALKPITREEQYLAYIAGESKSFPTTPITREEAFLDKIAKNGAGGGGSGINVQPLNATANGTYDAPEGQAYDPVTVDVKPITEPITITENGVYPVPKGGSLDYGKTVTFKEYISLEDFQAFLQSLGLSKPTDLYAAIAADADAGRAQLLGMTTSSYALRLHYQLLQPKEDGMGSTIIEHLVYGVYLDGSGTHGWGNELTGEMLNEPPTITILSAPPPKPQYEISQFEPLFDIETKSLDGWGDITVNVAGGGGDIVFPNDNETRIAIEIPSTLRATIPVYFHTQANYHLVIDWGDGNTETQTGSTGNYMSFSHTYKQDGKYIITIHNESALQFNLGYGHSGGGAVGSADNTPWYANMTKKVHLGKGIRTLNDYLFYRNLSLESVTMSDHIIYMGDYVFYYCSSLKEVQLSKSITALGDNAFKSCTSLRRVILPDTITTIPSGTFDGCSCLAIIDLPDTITSINNNAFSGCESLTKMVFPQGLTNIGDSAFNYCRGMKVYDFTKCTAIPTAGSQIFRQIKSDCEILVPSALYDEWIAATNWATYASNIVAV